VEHRVDDEADQLHRAGVGEHDVLRQEPAVGDPVAVRDRDRLRHLTHQPGGAARVERLVDQQPVEGLAGAPLVDDVDEGALLERVEHAEDPAVGHGGGGAGGGEDGA
jgi:hypothetical protein